MSTWGIGQLAKRAGVAIHTVRYCERNNLLVSARRLASGYRRYGETELKRLRFIQRAKALGFSLEEIRALLSLSAERSVTKIKRAAEAKLNDIERRIAELERWDRACPWPVGGDRCEHEAESRVRADLHRIGRVDRSGPAVSGIWAVAEPDGGGAGN